MNITNSHQNIECQSNFEKVREFTKSTNSHCPVKPTLMSLDSAKFLVNMGISEIVEFLQTFNLNKEQIKEFISNSVDVDFNEINYSVKSLLLDWITLGYNNYKYDKYVFIDNLSNIIFPHDIDIDRISLLIENESITIEYIDIIFDNLPDYIYSNNDNLSLPFTKYHYIAEQGDAWVDLWYYALNAFSKTGVDLSKIFEEVHNANLNKKGDDGNYIIRKHDGKILKPKNWKPANVEKCIYTQDKI